MSNTTVSSDPNDSYVAKTLAIEATFAGLATVAVICRFYARGLTRLEIWWDDWTALISLVWVWAFFGCIAASLPLGNARHIDQVDPENLQTILLLTWCYQIFYVLAPTTVKISALLLYRRIFISQMYSRIVTFLLGVMVCWGIAAVLISIFSCSPPSAFWTGVGHCIEWHAWVVAFAVPNILFDFLIWLLPLPRIWTMQLPRHHKVALTVIFLLGLTDCAAAIVRISTAAQALGEMDYTYTWIPATWWCVIHPSIGIVTICLPTMRILLVMIGKAFKLSWSTNEASNRSDSVRASGRWPRRPVAYDRINELGMSLSGETDHNIHSNAIAMALRNNSDTDTLRDNEIKVTSDFKVETSTKELSEEEMNKHVER